MTRPSGTGGRRMWAVGLGIIVLTSLVRLWPGSSVSAGGYEPFGLQRSSTPPGPVLITAVRTGLIWRSGIVPPTTITVRNDTPERADCQVWWILSRRGDPRPWDDPIQQSLPVAVSPAPLASMSLAVNQLAASSPRPGTFKLSTWVHCRDRLTGAWLPSDGATVGGAVRVLTSSSSLDHRASNSTYFWIDAASARRLFEGRPGRIRVTIANSWVEPVMVQVACSLTRPDTVLSDGRVADPAVRASQCKPVDVNLAAVGLTTVDVTIPRLPPPGRYGLWIAARLEQATATIIVDSSRVNPEVAVNA